MTNFTKQVFTLFFALTVMTLPLTAQVFWSEDFDGAIPADWTAMEVQGNGLAFSNWVFTTVGPQGPFAVAALNSTTADNGWVIMDSDANCNPDGVQEAWLISPPINAEDKAQVWMSFETIWASFNDSVTVHVGTDLANMQEWTLYDVFPGITNNQYGDGSAVTSAPTNNPQNVLVNISGDAAGEANFYFAFRFLSDLTTLDAGDYAGCAYSWQIDDIELNETSPLPPHDLDLGAFSISPNAVYPLSQVEPIYFLADLENVGSADQTNATVSVEVTEGGTPVFNSEINYGTLEVDSFANAQLVTDPFLPTATGTYLATYTASADSTDVDPANNTAAYTFIVNDSSFQKETEVPNSATLTGLYPQNPAPWDDPVIPHQWGIGNIFYSPGGAANYLRYVTFSIDGTGGNAGEILFITVYRWEDENGDFALNATERDNEALIGATTYTIEGNEDPDFLITIPFYNIAGTDVNLTEPGLYAVVVEHLTTATDDSKQVVVGGSSARDYFPMVVTWFDFVQDPRWAAVVGVNDNVNDGQLAGTDYETNLYALVPIVRAHVGPVPVTSTNDLLTPENRTLVFPNPASDVTNLELDFTEAMERVEIRINDIQGRNYLVQQLENVKTQTLEFNLENIPSGAYFFEIITEKGIRTENFVIQH